MRSWPKYNMHCEAKCHLPIHPSQIQIVDMTEGYKVSNEDLGNSPAIRKLQTSTVSQMRVPLDLLFQSSTQMGLFGRYETGGEKFTSTVWHQQEFIHGKTATV